LKTYVGDYEAGATVYIPWNTVDQDGASVSRGSPVGDIRVYRDDSTTQRTSDAGITDNDDFDGVVGVHMLVVDTSDNTDAGFYATGHDYSVMTVGEDLDGSTVNAWIGQFSIENRFTG
jgi:hypothetical protein